MSRSKAYTAAANSVSQECLVSPKVAIESLKNIHFAKFDETVELHFNLGIDPRHADQQLRGTINLPNGTGRTVRMVVIAPEAKHDIALKAGADIVGEADVIEKIQKGWTEFDIVIATPEVMSKVGRLGKVLGTRGLMPSPKSGTVTSDLEKTVSEFKAGKIEYRNDKQGLIHVILGKASFTSDQLLENFMVVYDTIVKAKPSKAKGVYLKSVALCTTMSPSVKVEPLKVKWKEN